MALNNSFGFRRAQRDGRRQGVRGVGKILRSYGSARHPRVSSNAACSGVTPRYFREALRGSGGQFETLYSFEFEGARPVGKLIEGHRWDALRVKRAKAGKMIASAAILLSPETARLSRSRRRELRRILHHFRPGTHGAAAAGRFYPRSGYEFLLARRPTGAPAARGHPFRWPRMGATRCSLIAPTPWAQAPKARLSQVRMAPSTVQPRSAGQTAWALFKINRPPERTRFAPFLQRGGWPPAGDWPPARR